MATSAPDPYVDSVDGLIDALKADPVNVQQVAGNGQTEAVDAAITEMVTGSGTPVYVALVGDLPGLSDSDGVGDLIARMHARIGEDGYYLAAVDYHFQWDYYGDTDIGSAAQDAVTEGYWSLSREENNSLTIAGQAGMVTSVVTDPALEKPDAATFVSQVPWRAPAEVDLPDRSDIPYAAMWATALGVLVLLVCWRLGRTWATSPAVRRAAASPPRQRAAAESPWAIVGPRPTTLNRDDLRARASSALEALCEALAKGPGSRRTEDALGCRVAAERLLDSAEPLDLVGALVLAQRGVALIELSQARPPCFINPLHDGRAEPTRLDAGRSGSAVEVPLCSRCRRAESGIGLPDPLLDRDGEPYYRGDSVWARTGYGALDDEPWRPVLEERR